MNNKYDIDCRSRGVYRMLNTVDYCLNLLFILSDPSIPHLFYEFPPLFRSNPSGLVVTDINRISLQAGGRRLEDDLYAPFPRLFRTHSTALV